MNQHDATNLFVKTLMEDVCISSVNGMRNRLHTATGIDEEELTAARTWYSSQSDESRSHVDYLVKDAVTLSVSSVALLLDGNSGFVEIGEGRGEIAVSLRVYDTVNNAMLGAPNEVVQIAPTDHGPTIFDLLMDHIVDADVDGAWNKPHEE